MQNNQIHPTAIIGEQVVIGKNNVIGPYTIIEGKTEIGDNNFIGSHVVLGCSATDTKHIESNFLDPKLIIGNHNIIREYSLIEQPCYEDKTIIGNHIFMMQGTHISHDAHIYDHVIITNLSVIAGIVKILEGANVSMACTVNQYTVLGHYSIVATNAAVMKNVKPFSRYIPGKPNSVNYYAIKKYGFEDLTPEIEKYVLENQYPISSKLMNIVTEFDFWVNKYGHQTY